MAEVENGWDAMAEACAIFKKYASERYSRSPFHCGHDIFTVCGGVEPADVSDEDKARLEELGFLRRRGVRRTAVSQLQVR